MNAYRGALQANPQHAGQITANMLPESSSDMRTLFGEIFPGGLPATHADAQRIIWEESDWIMEWALDAQERINNEMIRILAPPVHTEPIQYIVRPGSTDTNQILDAVLLMIEELSN